MNSIVKQCIINQLNLPYDVRDTIKSFCFYDIKTWETIQFIKNKKQEIDLIFKYKTTSRATAPSQFYANDDEDNNWVFFIDTDYEKCQFQGSNCTVCGNYISLYSPNYISQKIVCNCQNDHEDFDDFTYISGYTDYTDGTDW